MAGFSLNSIIGKTTAGLTLGFSIEETIGSGGDSGMKK